MIKLIVGLGNPGAEYEQTRHNAGFWLVDALCRSQCIELRNESRFHGLHARGAVAGRQVSLLKPSTFMNRSGQSVSACAGFFKYAPEEILVVHDELDLAPGTVRLKSAGGHGGHNGLRDICAHMGRDFHRVRIGIGHPGSAGRVLSWVLARPSADDFIAIEHAISRVLDQMNDIINDRMQQAMTALHTRQAKAE